MKKLFITIIIAVLAAIALGLLTFYPDTVSIRPPEATEAPVTIEKTVEVEVLEKRIEDAQNAAQAEIEKAAQEAYNYAYEQAMLTIATEVRDQYIAELEAVNQADKEKLQAY